MRAVVLLLLLLSSWPAAAKDDVAATVRRFSDTLVAAMKGGAAMGYQGRFDLLAPVVDDTFALPAMARLALGPAARQMTPEQAQRLTEAFRQWTVATYASEFKSWDGERIEVGPPRPSADALVIPTRIVPRRGEATRIDYVMREVDGRWRTVDLLLQGSVSQLAVRRSEFVSVVRRQGFDGLVELLRQRSAALAAR